MKQHRRILCTNLLTSSRLNSYLADIDKQAEELFLRLAEQMEEREGITEKLKAEHPMEWVGIMNALREAATEIVNTEVIFAQTKADRKVVKLSLKRFQTQNRGARYKILAPRFLCLKNGLKLGFFSS